MECHRNVFANKNWKRPTDKFAHCDWVSSQAYHRIIVYHLSIQIWWKSSFHVGRIYSYLNNRFRYSSVFYFLFTTSKQKNRSIWKAKPGKNKKSAISRMFSVHGANHATVAWKRAISFVASRSSNQSTTHHHPETNCRCYNLLFIYQICMVSFDGAEITRPNAPHTEKKQIPEYTSLSVRLNSLIRLFRVIM